MALIATADLDITTATSAVGSERIVLSKLYVVGSDGYFTAVAIGGIGAQRRLADHDSGRRRQWRRGRRGRLLRLFWGATWRGQRNAAGRQRTTAVEQAVGNGLLGSNNFNAAAADDAAGIDVRLGNAQLFSLDGKLAGTLIALHRQLSIGRLGKGRLANINARLTLYADLRGLQPHFATCSAARGVNQAASCQSNLRRGQLYATADPVGRRGVNDMAVGDSSMAAGQANSTAVAGANAARLDDAGIVNRQARQLVGGLDGHNNIAAIGLNNAAVIDIGVYHRAFDLNRHRATQVETHALASTQQDVATFGIEAADIFHFGGNHHHKTAGASDYVALVDDDPRGTTREGVIAGHKVFVRDVQGRGHQPGNIDHRALTKHDAVGVDQKYSAVGDQRTANLRGITAEYAVQRHRATGRLQVLDTIALTDVVTLPVDRHPIAALANNHAVAVALDRGATGRHLPTLGQVGKSDTTHQQPAGTGKQLPQRGQLGAAAAVCFCFALGDLRNRLPHLQGHVPDNAINMIERATFHFY